MLIDIGLYKELRKEIINNFKQFCKNKGWTHKEAAEELECSRSHISKIFIGTRNPSIELLYKMEEVMNKYGK